MKNAPQKKNEIPADFKPRVRWVKKANMFLRVSAKDGKIVHEWFKDNPDKISNDKTM